ncbi:MAG: protein kinase, partial [Clostridia bacterium]|nr:protein kinase [Clostridia bacterium]
MKEFVFPGWEIVEQIGSGGFSKVYKIKKSDNSNSGFYSALKVIHIPNTSEEIDSYRSEGYDDNSITQIFDEQVKSIVQEFELMHRFRGVTNIVSYEDHLVMQNENGIGWTILIRMELLKTLPDYYKTRVIKDNDVKQLGIDICKALKLCEQKNIVHRDIKPQNIFANDFDDFKLGDFGVARVMEHTTRATKIGTYSYMAPEVYNGKPYNYISDIYSLGMVLYWLLNERRLPFLPLPPAVPTPSVNNEAQARRLSGEPLPAPKYGSEELKQVVLKACAFDPAERYSSAEEFMAALQNAACAGEVCNPSVAATVLPDDDKTVFIGTNAVNGTASGPETPADDDKTVSIFSTIPMSDFPKSEPASAPAKEEAFQTPSAIQPAEEKAEEPAVSVAVDSDDDRTVAFFEEATVVEAAIKTAQPKEEPKKDIPADKVEAEPITGPKEPVEKKSKKGLVFGVAAIAAIIIVIILLLTNCSGNNTDGDYTSQNSFEESSDINIENSSEDASSKDDTIS